MKIEEFREYAKSFNVIPVYRKLLADSETPLGIYRNLPRMHHLPSYLNQPNMVERGHVIHLLGPIAKQL